MTFISCRAAILTIAVVILAAGCAVTHDVKPELLPAPTASAMVQQWPLSVGVYIPPSVRSREFAKDLWRVKGGGASIASTFQWALAQLFAEVVLLDAPPSVGKVPDGLVGVIELSDVAPKHAGVLASYEISFYSAKGEKIASWTLNGSAFIWDTEGSSLSSSLHSVGTDLTYVIRDLTASFMVELPRQESVRRWLEDANIRPAELRPFLKVQAAKPQNANKVMILPTLPLWRYTDHATAMECVGNHLRAYNPPVEIVLAESVRFDFFPWLEPSTAPTNLEDLRTLVFQPAIEQKIRGLGVRYLLSIQGGTTTSIPGGGIFCGGSGMGAGCFGFAYGSHQSSFTASIIDLQENGEHSEVASKQSSDVYVPAFLLPIPLIAPTEAAACERLARDIHTAIAKNRQ
jgi:hypothetical protein